MTLTPYQLSTQELEALQAKCTDVLAWFVSFCAAHNLRVWLAAGTLLGAARHHGFIPWDDDVDVMMPRPDFETLVKLWPVEDTEHYSFVRTTKTMVNHDPTAVVCDNLTTAVKIQHYDVDMPQGLPIDVFPLDGCPNSRLARVLQIFWYYVFGVYQAQFAPKTHGRLVYLATKLALAIVPSKAMRYRIWSFAERRMTATPYGSTPWVRFLYGGPVSAKWELPLDIFDNTTYCDFHGHQMPIPAQFDRLLTKWFGDWRQLPPEDQRQPHHDLTFLDLNTPYEHYRGVKFCVAPAATPIVTES